MTTCIRDLTIHVYDNVLIHKLLSYLPTILYILILLALLIIPVWLGVVSFRKGLKEKKLTKKLILLFQPILSIFFLWLLFGIILMGCDPSKKTIYSSSDFVEKVGETKYFYEVFVFHPEGKLDISSSPYTFECAIEECDVVIENQGKTVVSYSDVEQGALLYTCKSEDVVYIDTNHGNAGAFNYPTRNAIENCQNT